MSPLQVFISWSGEPAKAVAAALRDLLPVIFDGVTPWMSERDIEAGSRGLVEIAQKLDATAFGVIVVTRSNQAAPWVNFEAGALSKRFGEDGTARVVPLLVDLDAVAELTGPLAQFQAKLLNHDGISDLLVAIGSAIGVSAEVVKRRLRNEWQDFQDSVERAKTAVSDAQQTPKRTVESVAEETLELVRDLHRRSTSGGTVRSRSKGEEDFRMRISELRSYAEEAYGPEVEVRGQWSQARQVGRAVLIGPEELSTDSQLVDWWGAARKAGIEVTEVRVNGREIPPF